VGPFLGVLRKNYPDNNPTVLAAKEAFQELQVTPLPAKKLRAKLYDSIRSSDFIVISITRPRGLMSDLPLLSPIIDLPGGAMTSAIGLSPGHESFRLPLGPLPADSVDLRPDDDCAGGQNN